MPGRPPIHHVVLHPTGYEQACYEYQLYQSHEHEQPGKEWRIVRQHHVRQLHPGLKLY